MKVQLRRLRRTIKIDWLVLVEGDYRHEPVPTIACTDLPARQRLTWGYPLGAFGNLPENVPQKGWLAVRQALGLLLDILSNT